MRYDQIFSNMLIKQWNNSHSKILPKIFFKNLETIYANHLHKANVIPRRKLEPYHLTPYLPSFAPSKCSIKVEAQTTPLSSANLAR